jgi:ribosomal protein S18 acetylase RimI-like enzyme
MGWNSKEKKQEMTIPDMSYIIVLDNNNSNNRNVVGFCSFLLNTQQEILDKTFDICYLYEIHIDRKFQNLKIGTTLLDKVKQKCIQSNLYAIVLTVFNINQNAQRLYQTHGFIPIQDPSSTTNNNMINTRSGKYLAKPGWIEMQWINNDVTNA